MIKKLQTNINMCKGDLCENGRNKKIQKYKITLYYILYWINPLL